MALSSYDAMLARGDESPVDSVWEELDEKIRDEGCPDCGNDDPELFYDHDYDGESAEAKCKKCDGVIGISLVPDPDDKAEDRRINRENREG